MSEKSGLIGRFLGRYELKKLISNKKISILSSLIVIGTCFFYVEIFHFWPKCYKNDFGANLIFSADFKDSDIVKNLKSSFKSEESKLSINSRADGIKPDPSGLIMSNNFGRSTSRLRILDSHYDTEANTNKVTDTSDSFEKKLYALVGNAPIREMVPYIAKKEDRRVAGLIIGIAKKESDWGRRSPSKGGRNCYNFWGYKGAGSRGTAMGYGCFASAEEGVEAITGRIQELVNKKIDNPSRIVVWKCGSSCAGHDPAGVRKWISDVSIYFNKIVKMEG